MAADIKRRRSARPPTPTYQKVVVWVLFMMCLAGLIYKIVLWLNR